MSHVPIRKHSKVHRLPRATRRCPEPHAPAHDRRRHRHHDAPTPLRYSSVASPHSLDAPGALPKVHPPAPLLSRPLPAPRKAKAVPFDVRARVLLDVDLRDVVSVPKDPPACGALFGVHFDVAHFGRKRCAQGVVSLRRKLFGCVKVCICVCRKARCRSFCIVCIGRVWRREKIPGIITRGRSGREVFKGARVATSWARSEPLPRACPNVLCFV